MTILTAVGRCVGTATRPRLLMGIHRSTAVSATVGPALALHAPFLSVGFASKAKSKKAEAPPAVGYLEQKKDAKERRRGAYEIKIARNERVKTRQSERPRDEKKRAFRSWFLKKKVDEEYMNRKARQAGLEWEIHVAVIVERLNVVLPDKAEWEVEYENLKAHMQQFGTEYPKELFSVNTDKPTAVSDEELLELLPKGFTPAPRETEADASGNFRTTDRNLKTNVVLAVQDGDAAHWQLPTVPLLNDDNETLLQAAKRAVKEKVGEQVEFWSPSNSPFAVDMVAFPEDQRKNGFYGTKTFFIKVQYDGGDVSESAMTVKDFAWLDRMEMAERVQQDRGDYESKFYQYML